MCRLLGYQGPTVSLANVLTEPEHSLVVQSYAPKTMSAGTVNADGFGLAWYDGRRPAPYAYRGTAPIWTDPNLDDLSAYVQTGHMLAYVRSATPGQGLDIANTQPFAAGPVSFVHNGFVDGFTGTDGIRLRRALEAGLDDAHWPLLRAGTDSGYVFAWLMQHLAGAPWEEAIPAAMAALSSLPGLTRAGLNFLLSDGERIAAVRHAVGTECPTLHVANNPAGMPGATLVASEPLFEDPAWRALPPRSLTILSADDPTRYDPVALAA